MSGGCTNTDYLAVHLADAGGGTDGDTLEFQVNGTGLEHWVNPHSAAIPAADSASAGALAIGAIDPATGTLIAGYSSQGPTNDDRIKPDISAASCVSSYTFAPQCFNGTSAAAPVAAGAAALVRGAGLAATPAALKSWLLTNAFVDRGPAGADSVYGVGELRLPAPPDPDTAPTISDIPDQSTAQATPKGPIGFTVGDAESPAGGLIVSGTSSNQALVPEFEHRVRRLRCQPDRDPDARGRPGGQRHDHGQGLGRRADHQRHLRARRRRERRVPTTAGSPTTCCRWRRA